MRCVAWTVLDSLAAAHIADAGRGMKLVLKCCRMTDGLNAKLHGFQLLSTTQLAMLAAKTSVKMNNTMSWIPQKEWHLLIEL
jgi:hypothetical protein